MISAKREFVTPEMASAWIVNSNMVNRKISKPMVHRIARDITNMRWRENGETVILNCNGGALDGIHRLLGIEEAGMGVWMLVCRGVDESAVPTIDTGRSRSFPDVLTMSGYVHNQRVIAGAVRIVQGHSLNSGTWYERGKNNESNDVLLEFLQQTPDLLECLPIGLEIGKLFKKAFQSAKATALYYIFSKKDKAVADSFFANLQSGANLPEDSPVLLLRERLLREKDNKRLPREKEMMGLIVKAWNATRTGYTMKRLQFVDKEKMPQIL